MHIGAFSSKEGQPNSLGARLAYWGKTRHMTMWSVAIGTPTKIKADKGSQVVGGGTSGLAVAKRLAENPTVSVAVIEAGGFYELDNSNISQIPAFFTFNSNSAPDPGNIQPLIDWGIITTAQAVSTSEANFANHFSSNLGSEQS